MSDGTATGTTATGATTPDDAVAPGRPAADRELVWLVTGASTGFGWHLADRAARRGDLVLATARRPESLDGLVEAHPGRVVATRLDVTRPDEVRAARDLALERFGRLDVVANNAGYGLAGAVEEVTDAEIRAQFDTNVFGALDVVRAVLPVLRDQGSGHLVQVSSVGGVRGLPGVGAYNASKFALEGFSYALAQEVEPFGVRVTIVEPSGFRTDWAGRSLVLSERTIDAYDGTPAHENRAAVPARSGRQPGDPVLAAEAIVTVAHHPEPPLFLPLGVAAVRGVREVVARRLADLEQWVELAESTDRPPAG